MSTIRRFLARETPFSYACGGCGRCCRDQRITLSPYEIARLARATGATTRDILERHTDEGGTVLRFGEDGACTFLRDGACSVHEGRPLACRLYPLGRIVRGEHEFFVELEPRARSAGAYGQVGTVDDWVDVQGARPFIETARRYHELLTKMAEVLSTLEDGRAALEATLAAPEPARSDWLDVDAVVSDACRSQGSAEPAFGDTDARVEIHLHQLERWVATFE